MDVSQFIPASWRTTLFGIIGAISIICGQFLTLADDDPKTNPDISVIAGTVATMFGFAVARDRKVSTEQERGDE